MNWFRAPTWEKNVIDAGLRDGLERGAVPGNAGHAGTGGACTVSDHFIRRNGQLYAAPMGGASDWSF